MKNLKRLLILSLVFIGLSSFAGLVPRDTYLYQSVYIYQFTKYIDWGEENTNQPITIGVLGNEQAVLGLEKITRYANLREQKFIIKHFESIDEITDCHILFLTQDHTRKFLMVTAKLKDAATLLITEDPYLSRKGSCINFIAEDGKIKFELDKHGITSKGLKISDKLLRLAILI